MNDDVLNLSRWLINAPVSGVYRSARFHAMGADDALIKCVLYVECAGKPTAQGTGTGDTVELAYIAAYQDLVAWVA